MTRKLSLALATTVVAAAALTGCGPLPGYAVRSESATQQDTIGDTVHLGATLCLDTGASDTTPSSTEAVRGIAWPKAGVGQCADGDDGSEVPYLTEFAGDGGLQFFAAFLVPDGATAP